MSAVSLRRTLVAWMMLTSAPVMAPLCVFSVFYGAAKSEIGLTIYGFIVLGVLAWPGLLGASVDARAVVFGWRWHRTTILTSDVAKLHVGRFDGFGFRGAPALGLMVELSDGKLALVPESRFCRRDRLLEWCAVVSERCPAPVETIVHRIPVSRSASRSTGTK